MSRLIDEVERQIDVLDTSGTTGGTTTGGTTMGHANTNFTLFASKIMFSDIPSTIQDVEQLFAKYGFKRCFLIGNDKYTPIRDKQALWDNFGTATGVSVNVFVDDTYIE